MISMPAAASYHEWKATEPIGVLPSPDIQTIDGERNIFRACPLFFAIAYSSRSRKCTPLDGCIQFLTVTQYDNN